MVTSEDKTAAEDQAGEIEWMQGLNHITLAVRDIDEATTFWICIFNGLPYRDHETGKKLRHILLGDTVLFFNDTPGLVGWELEYPHYGFTVTSDNLYSLKARLEAAGVKTHPLWTRNDAVGLMYFRDPSGNLFELYCSKLEGADDRSKVRFAKSHGGDFVPPVSDLRYDWDARRVAGLEKSAEGQDRLEGFNHMTLPVRDVEEATRFWTGLFGAEIFKYGADGRVSHLKFPRGLVLHFGQGEGLVGWEFENPHYAFTVASDKLFALKERLENAGVATHPIWTRNGAEGLMYFRDPTGNLFELYCEHFDGADDASRVRIAKTYGGDFVPPVAGLTYDWKG